MKTLERKYSKSERIIAKAKFSACVYFKSILLAILLGGIIAVIWVFNAQIEHVFTKAEGEAMYLTDTVMRWVLLGAGVLVIACFIIQSIMLYSKELILTEDKIVFRKGAIAVTNSIIPLNEIKIVETEQNFLQRLFFTGTVSIVSDAVKPYKIKGVRAADRFTRRIMKQVAASRQESESRSVQLQLAGYAKKKSN